MKAIRPFAAIALLIVCFTSSVFADESGWSNLIETTDVASPVAGQWQIENGALTTDGNGAARIAMPFQPKAEYDIRVRFTRQTGQHSVALFCPTSGGLVAFDIDAWGQHLAGFQNVNGQSLREITPQKEVTLENGREYTATVEVRAGRIRALLDGDVIAEQATDGTRFELPGVWQMPDTSAVGLGAYSSQTTFHAVEVREVSGGAALMAATAPQTAGRDRPMRRDAGTSTPPSTTTPPTVASTETPARPNMRTAPRGGSGKRVLIVIATEHFFYREYNDPRNALEQAGIEVEVAAGRRVACRPHRNSGETGSGEVMPDLAIADVDPSRYDAIMFSGGWGSSMYQYAFPGSYRTNFYNGDRQTKDAVNRLLNEFIEQDKIVGALCHGISVLAWARVNGRSILDGRRAVGSPRQSPAGTYPGLREVPLSRWNAEANGARLSPVRSIGDPRNSIEDVVVDGKIITGEDDVSAALFGRVLAEMVLNESR